ncbi:hypothetical protein D3C81_997660 [compost metagenome]
MLQNDKAIAKRFMEALLFSMNHLLDKLAFCNDISIVRTHNVANRSYQSEHKRLVQT